MTAYTPLNVAEQPGPETSGDGWIAIHIYYADDLNLLLTRCVAPLVRRLRSEELINGCFFVRHWLEGQHLRLRMRVAVDGDPAVVRARTEEALEEFLVRRPSLRDPGTVVGAARAKELFLLEYSELQWNELYGSRGSMPIRPNNSYAYMRYEFELERYGGAEAAELVEWHFQRSSAMVLDLLESANIHVRTVMLGVALQFMTAMCAALTPDAEGAVRFLDRYGAMWQSKAGAVRGDYAAAYERMADALSRKVTRIYTTVSAGRVSTLNGTMRDWAEHGVELRDAITASAERGTLMFGSRQSPATPEQAMSLLLGSFLHMTNNRLGAGLGDEAYLSYLISRAMREQI